MAVKRLREAVEMFDRDLQYDDQTNDEERRFAVMQIRDEVERLIAGGGIE